MAKKLIKLALRLTLLNVVSIFIMLFLFYLTQNAIVLWFMTAVMTILLLTFVWRDAQSAGQKDAHNDRLLAKRIAEGADVSPQEKPVYKKWFGFAAGLVAQFPAVLLLLGVLAFMGIPEVSGMLIGLAKFWFITYYQPIFGGLFPDTFLPLIMLLCIALFAATAGLAYLRGPALERKVETIIERSKTKRPMRVQDEWALEKKRKGKGGKKLS